MHRTLAILSSLAAVVSAIGATGCSSSSSTAPPGTMGASCDTSTPVSFKTDVLPVFQLSCTLSSVCHGQMGNSGEESLYLGENSSVSATDPNAVYNGLVGVAAKENPSMPLIKAGDLDNSFLWQKVAVIGSSAGLSASVLAGCTAAPAPLCSDCSPTTPCGTVMPYQEEPLNSTASGAAFQCTLQSWIVQGAMNN